MTIGIDLRCLPSDGSPGAGIAHAAREVSKVLVTMEGETKWRIFLPDGALFSETPIGQQIGIVRLPSDSGSVLREALSVHPCDRLFVPSGAIPPGIRTPTVPWVHDLSIFEHPEWFPQSFLRRVATTNLFRHGILKSSSVLAVSDFTKRQLMYHFALPASRVTVTYEGGDVVLGAFSGAELREAKQKAKARVAERGITQPFILWLGMVEPRKNLGVLTEAWQRARSRFRVPVDLVVGGKDGWKLGPIHAAFDRLKTYGNESAARFHRLNAVSDDDRRDLLLAAELVALPSWEEGFGLVALEAAQAGTAVVASARGAFREILGEGGVILPPEDAAAWTDAFVALMDDDASRQSLAERGKSQGQGFGWQRTAGIIHGALTSNAS